MRGTRTLEVFVDVCLILLLAVFLFFRDGRALAVQVEEAGKTAGRSGASELVGQQAKQGYALGMLLGKRLRVGSVEVDVDLCMQGVRDALSGGETLLSEREARAVVSELQRELKTKRAAPPPAGDLSDIRVSFKLDPRLTRAQYMGDRWVSKPTFTTTLQPGPEFAVEVRAQGLDAEGKPVSAAPQWIPQDPDMVAVTPSQGKLVTIKVKRPGETVLRVVSGEVTKELRIKGMDRDGAMQVKISQ